MAKIVAFNDESRRALERGVNALADAVRITGAERSECPLERFGTPNC